MTDDADFTYRLYDAMERLIEKAGVADASVKGFEQCTESYGYCSTCAGEETTVVIRYVTGLDDTPGEYVFRGDMGVLIRALTDQGHVA